MLFKTVENVRDYIDVIEGDVLVAAISKRNGEEWKITQYRRLSLFNLRSIVAYMESLK